MGLVVNTNTQSIFAQRALRQNTLGLKGNIERLSTGFRINKAADDAAGLSISEKLTSTIRAYEQAKKNAADGISLIQTAEGGLQIVQENLQRIRELFIQGVNDTNNTSERNAIQREINERVSTVEQIVAATKFNGQALLIAGTSKTLQLGPDTTDTMSIVLTPGAAATGIDVDIDDTTGGAGQLGEGATNATLAKFRLSGASVGSEDGTTSDAGTVADLDVMIDNISRMRSYLGAAQNALDSRMDYMDIALENASASRSRIKDVDVAKESSMLVKNQILQQSASAMLAQANAQPQIALQLIGG